MFEQKIAEFWNEKLKENAKHIAVSNVGHVALQQKYILLVLDFLQKNSNFKNKKVGVVSFHFQQGIFKDYTREGNPNFFQVPNTTKYDFLNWQYLIDRELTEQYFDSYDLVIWDLPDLNFIKMHSIQMERYFALFESMAIVSLPQNGTDEVNQINRINNFFNCHGFGLPEIKGNSLPVKKGSVLNIIKKLAGF